MIKKILYNKKLLIVISGLFILILVLCFFRPSYSIDKQYSREELQDRIVSTALSYYYNNVYSDYGQTSMEGALNGEFEKISSLPMKTFLWRNLNITPEEVSRSNRYFTDCSGFMYLTYKNSLDYDFSEYYALATGFRYFDNFNFENANKSQEAYKNFIANSAGLPNTNYFNKIGKNFYDTGNVSDDKLVVYYYAVTGNETIDDITSIRNDIYNTLEKGDMIVYRTRNAGSSSDVGHVMLYIGNDFDTNVDVIDGTSYEGGLLHAVGYDYVIASDGTVSQIGDDEFAIRYDTIQRLMRDIFINKDLVSVSSTYGDAVINANKKYSTYFTIFRPLNDVCDSDDSCSIKYDENVEARNDLSKLGIEQYAQYNTQYVDNLTANSATTKYSNKTIGGYNSVNVGDNVIYNLKLSNKSKMEYCTFGTYTTESKCTSNDYVWDTTSLEEINYNDLKITATIPDNASFVSCTGSCSYDKSSKTVTWTKDVNVNASVTLSYTIKVNYGDNIINEGMKIVTPNNNTLSLGEILLDINPTLNGINRDILLLNSEKYQSLVDNGQIIYGDASDSNDYKVSLDDMIKDTSSTLSLNQIEYVYNLYHNSYGMDFNYLTVDNVKNAIFDSDSLSNHTYTYTNPSTGESTVYKFINDVTIFSKRTEEEISLLTDDTYKKINQMLVPGMYGGQLLRGNANNDRATNLRSTDLEFGDIIFTFDEDNQSYVVYLFLGFKEGAMYISRFSEDDGLIYYTGVKVFREIYAKDLFVVLRPSRLLGTTVDYNYNNGNAIIPRYVAYDTYRNLITPTKNNFTLTLNYNNKNVSGYDTSFVGVNTFSGWYSDSNFTNKVSDSSKLISTDNHTLYAKWDTTKVILPNPQITGYFIEGWYSDSTLKNKVSDANTNYSIDSTETIYAKWVGIKYNIKYNANGGIGTMANSSHTYDIEASLSQNTFIRNGYIFKGWSTSKDGSLIYEDKEIVKNLTSTANDVINLYAIWEIIYPDIEVTSNYKYSIVNDYIKNIDIMTDINNLQLGLQNYYNYKIFDINKKEKSTGYIATGDKLQIYLDNSILVGEYTILILGDVDGSGTVELNDVTKLYQYLRSTIDMEDYFVEAGDVAGTDNKIKVSDVAKLFQFVRKKISSL